MSILIKGKNMPKTCALCFLRDDLHDYCPYEENKETDCPLVEVSDVPLMYKGEVVGWINGDAERNIILELTGISLPLGIIESEE